MNSWIRTLILLGVIYGVKTYGDYKYSMGYVDCVREGNELLKEEAEE